jgi:hypothetical protein
VLLILQQHPDSQKEEEEDDEKTLPKDRKMPSPFCLVSVLLNFFVSTLYVTNAAMGRFENSIPP